MARRASRTSSISSLLPSSRRQLQGFTIVELLIVVVVIAILAAITIVSFNGITQSANDSSVKSDVRQIAEGLLRGQAKTGELPVFTGTNGGPGFTFAVNQEAYYPGNSYNLYICQSSTNPNDGFGIAARSASGNVIAWKSGSFIEFSGSYGASDSNCPGLGYPAGTYNFTYGRVNNGSWAAWTK